MYGWYACVEYLRACVCVDVCEDVCVHLPPHCCLNDVLSKTPSDQARFSLPPLPTLLLTLPLKSTCGSSHAESLHAFEWLPRM